MDDLEVIDKAAEVFIRNAITNIANDTLRKLQDLLGIKTGDVSPGVAMHLQEHLDILTKDYCDILNDQRINARL